MPDFLEKIRLIATDMDGTLTRAGKFTPALLQALNDLAIAHLPVLIVTGRSAGWVNGIVSYLPIAGAIAENGGVFFANAEESPQFLVPIGDLQEYRHRLSQMFARLQANFPTLKESIDNQFRLTDWTFDVSGLTQADLQWMSDRCADEGWSFTYSTVQCHIKSQRQEKSAGLLQVVQQMYPQLSIEQILTIGDSPNDESLFDPQNFPNSIGVANVSHYKDRMRYFPTWVTQGEEVEGFCEVVRSLVLLHSTDGY